MMAASLRGAFLTSGNCLAVRCSADRFSTASYCLNPTPYCAPFTAMDKNAGQGSPATPKIGAVPIEVMQRYSGLEVLHRLKDGLLPVAPMSEVIPFALVDAEFGKAIVRSTPSERFYNTIGIVHGGYAMTLLDTCMGVAIYSTLSSGIGYTSIETKVNFVKPVTAETGPLRAVGHAVHTGTRTATAEGRLVDEEGRLYAHGTTTCFLYPLSAAPAR
jgi:uncharacterized protein (TIGR00369 family)